MEVEVVFPRVCGAFYQAYIQEINLQNGTAYLSFPSEWKPSVWVELSYIRLPVAKETAAASPRETFGAGSKVEALLPHHDNEPPGWWTGTLLKSRGELHVVEFQSGAEKYQDIVDHDKLRSPNTNQPLSKIKMYRKDFPVTEEIDDYCQRSAVHENFRSKIKALYVSYDKQNRSLTVLANDEQCLDRASLLIEMHFRDLRTQKSLLTKNEAAAQRYYQQQSLHRAVDAGLKEIRFHVPSDLVGMAIGREGANVNEARKITGISSVEFDDYSSMFSVKGESDEALQRARERLEFAREMMLIPRNLAGKVIGKKGNVIQEILEKSRVHNVKVVGEEEATDRNIDVQAQVPFDFIGRKSEIDNAKMMMEYHLDHLKKVETILSHRDVENSPQGDETFFPAPVPPGGYRRTGGYNRPGRGYQGAYRGRQRGRQSETHEDEGENTPPPSNEAAHDSDVDHKLSDEVSHSDSDSDSNQDQPDSDEKSAPEDDMQGPDRRRQPSRGRGGGPPRGGRMRSRGGRGYRYQRQGRSGRGRYNVSGGGGRGGGGNRRGSGGEAPTMNATSETGHVAGAELENRGGEGEEVQSGGRGGGEGVSTTTTTTASPKPQRQNRGGRRPYRGGGGYHRRGRGGGRGGHRSEEAPPSQSQPQEDTTSASPAAPTTTTESGPTNGVDPSA